MRKWPVKTGCDWQAGGQGLGRLSWAVTASVRYKGRSAVLTSLLSRTPRDGCFPTRTFKYNNAKTFNHSTRWPPTTTSSWTAASLCEDLWTSA